MPRIVIQNDDGDTVRTLQFPRGHAYQIFRIPTSSHAGINQMLRDLKVGLQDASFGNGPRGLEPKGLGPAEDSPYRIVRHFRDARPPALIQSGVPFKYARDHCAGPEGRGHGWHDSLEPEEGTGGTGDAA